MGPFIHTVHFDRDLVTDDTSTRFVGYRLRDDLYEWLIERVGIGLRTGGWVEDCQWLWDYKIRFDVGPADNHIVFRDGQVAMLFKLTWG